MKSSSAAGLLYCALHHTLSAQLQWPHLFLVLAIVEKKKKKWNPKVWAQESRQARSEQHSDTHSDMLLLKGK